MNKQPQLLSFTERLISDVCMPCMGNWKHFTAASIKRSTSVKFESVFVAIHLNYLGELGVALINQAYLSNKEMQIWRENFHVNESKWAKSKKFRSF